MVPKTITAEPYFVKIKEAIKRRDFIEDIIIFIFAVKEQKCAAEETEGEIKEETEMVARKIFSKFF